MKAADAGIAAACWTPFSSGTSLILENGYDWSRRNLDAPPRSEARVHPRSSGSGTSALDPPRKPSRPINKTKN